MRFTTTELSDLETRIANAAGQALTIELAAFDELVLMVVSYADAIKAAADALSVIDVTAALAELAQEQGYSRPRVDDSLAFSRSSPDGIRWSNRLCAVKQHSRL